MKTGWLKYISMVICINGASFASELSSDLKSATDDVTLSNCQNKIMHLDSFDDVLNEDSELIRKLDAISSDLFFPIILDVNENDVNELQNTREKLQDLIEQSQIKSRLPRPNWEEFRINFISSKNLIAHYCRNSKLNDEISYLSHDNYLKKILEQDITNISLNNFFHYIINLQTTFKKVFFINFHENSILHKLDIISTNLFFPIITYIDKDDCEKFQNVRQQFRVLIRNLKAHKITLQHDAWTEFRTHFILSQKLIDSFLDDAKIQEDITNPPYADKLKTLLNSDISTISLSNFCNHIIEFDYVLQKTFFTKPHVDGEPSCEKCGEQTVGMTMCYSQPVLECHFCGHESCIERIF